MHILNVEVKACKFSAESGGYHAILLMQGKDSRLSLRAAARMAEHAPKAEVLSELMADAIRQIRRLPEYRNTAREITLAQGALPRLS